MKSILKRIIYTVLSVLIGLVFSFNFYLKYSRIGTIVDIREDAIVLQGDGPYDPAYVLKLEDKSRFYNSDGDKITLSELKLGNHVKIQLFPRVYGGIFLVREQKTINWVKVLSK